MGEGSNKYPALTHLPPSASVLTPPTGQTQLEARGQGNLFLQHQGTEQRRGWDWRGTQKLQHGLTAPGLCSLGHLHINIPICK